jgi:hypothetical protein
MINHILTQQCVKIQTMTNAAGDKEEADEVSLVCRVRNIQSVEPRLNREDQESDSMAWFRPSAPIIKGDIFRHNNDVFRITQVTKARKFDGDVQFLKCIIEKYDNVEDQS